MKWLIQKELEFNGKKVKALVPNPKVSREKALKRFEELTEEIVRSKRAFV